APLAAWKHPDVAVTVNYGQIPAPGEIRAAAEIATALAIEHHVVTVDCSSLGSGDMAGRPQANVAPIPEWWPFRNQLLVTLAAMKAIALGVSTLYVGSVASDAQHADGSLRFYELLDQ